MIKLIKRVKNIIVDSGREYLQLLSLCICLVFPKLVNLSKIIRILLGGQKPDFETAKYYYLMILGNWVIGLLLVLYVLIIYLFINYFHMSVYFKLQYFT